MRVLLYLVLIMLATMAGTALLVNPFCTDWQERGIRQELIVPRELLKELALLLHKYKDVHGNYPNNDQGLAALDTFDAQFRSAAPADTSAYGNALGLTELLNWRYSMYALKEYREKYGGPPRNAHQLYEANLPWPIPEETSRSKFIEVEVGITPNDSILILSPAGVCSPWKLPYLYENRTGLDPAKFKFSPVNRDPKQQFSIRVDEGVYVYSVGALQLFEKLESIWWRNFFLAFPGAGLIVVAVLLFRRMLLISDSKPAGWVVMGVGALMGTLMGQGAYVTCYVGFRSAYRDPTPEMRTRQTELLDKYRAAGIINAETYSKAIAGLDLAKIGRPTTAPDTAPDEAKKGTPQ